ncbi:hypothetical protein GCM10027406_07790 [Leifsonia lichenia]
MVSALSGVGVVAAAVAAPGIPAFASGASLAGVATADAAPAAAAAALTRSLFLPAVGRRFIATSDARSIHLSLTAIEDLAGDATADDEHRFSLLFSAGGYAAKDDIYTLSCDGVPTTTLFLTTIGPRALTRSMQAIVNRNA